MNVLPAEPVLIQSSTEPDTQWAQGNGSDHCLDEKYSLRTRLLVIVALSLSLWALIGLFALIAI